MYKKCMAQENQEAWRMCLHKLPTLERKTPMESYVDDFEKAHFIKGWYSLKQSCVYGPLEYLYTALNMCTLAF